MRKTNQAHSELREIIKSEILTVIPHLLDIAECGTNLAQATYNATVPHDMVIGILGELNSTFITKIL